MRYGIFSDVHSNQEAMQAVLDFYKQKEINEYFFLGDAIGYGPNPNEACYLIRQLEPLQKVVGNHDAAVIGLMPYDDYYPAAKQALNWTGEQLSEDNRSWLKEAPYKIIKDDLSFSHGSPVVPEAFEYLYLPEMVIDLYHVWDNLSPITFIGHSHLSISFKIQDETVVPMMDDLIECEPDCKYIITVGSVGQPRDRDARACCGIFDTETKTFEYHRIDYAKEETCKKIFSAGLAHAFGERLLLGM